MTGQPAADDDPAAHPAWAYCPVRTWCEKRGDPILGPCPECREDYAEEVPIDG